MNTLSRPKLRVRLFSSAPLALAILLAPAIAGAQPEPADARAKPDVARDRVQAAAAEYDAGRRAYMDGKFEEAAVHFENAWHDAPRAEPLRNAIRARVEAKQLSRAATLAAVGERLYSGDSTTMALVRATLDEAAPSLHKVTLACAPECDVAVDGRAVTFESDTRATLFVEPGPHEVLVSWSAGRSQALHVTGGAGTAEELSVTAPPLPPAPPPPIPEPRPAPVALKPLGPAIFLIGAGLTAAGLAATIISGVDAQNSPGTDAVRRDCVGLGESCPAYQDGQRAQLRTNILLGGTVGVGVITGIIGLFFTEWSSSRRTVLPREAPVAGAPMRGPQLTFGAWSGGGHVGVAGAL